MIVEIKDKETKKRTSCHLETFRRTKGKVIPEVYPLDGKRRNFRKEYSSVLRKEDIHLLNRKQAGEKEGIEGQSDQRGWKRRFFLQKWNPRHR